MIKRSMSRNTRAKGIRVRHIVQILLLLGVCIWLIYQVKHSHDKKKALNDNDGDEKSSEKMQNDLGFLKFGRKDLDPWVEKAGTSEKHKEEAEEVEDENGGEDEERKHDEEEEEAKHEEEENREEEEAKHEEENREEEETKPEEAENEGRGGGDDEIDENDQENEENADFIDDEKEKDNVEGEAETDEKGDQDDETGDKDDREEEISSEDNESDEKTHEAREEHYKGDDASSAVTHDTRFSNAESGETNLDSNNLEHEEPSKETRQVHDSSRIMEEEGTDKTTKDGNLADAVDLDRSKATESNEQEDPHANDADQVKTEAGIGQTIYNSTETQNHTVNPWTDGSTGNDLVRESTYSNSNLTISLKDENENGNMEASLKSSNDSESVQLEESGVTEEATDGANGNKNAAEKDPIDSSDLDTGHELEENHMDFDTLPEIRTEIDNSDDTSAE